MFTRIAFAAVFSISLISGCTSSSSNIPLVEPPVAAVTPSGLTSRQSARSLDVNEIKSRFFSSGPTTISNLLTAIDDRLEEINTRSTQGSHPCLSATAVAEEITVMGETKTAYFQCYDVFSDGTGGMLFGKKDDVWYLYTNVGTERAFVMINLVSGTTDKYEVEAWMTVGQENTPSWYSMSYGVIHLKANSSTGLLEMTVAGTGIGFCGGHLQSDGTNLYVKGSTGGTSDGSSWSCAAAADNCVLASNIASSGDCTNLSVSTFDLTSLGVTGQSTFGTGITLDGNTTDAVHFGPAVDALDEITGVDKF